MQSLPKNNLRGTPAADFGMFLFLPGVQEANFHDRRDVAERLHGLQEEILSALFDEGEGIVWMYMQDLWECEFGGS